MTLSEMAQLTAITISAVGLIVSLRRLRDQLRLQTFMEFTKRYVDVLDGLPRRALGPESAWNPETLTEDERIDLARAIRRWANLCSQEYYLRGAGRVDEATWNIWKEGIENSMARRPFRDGWRMIEGEYKYYPAFHAFMWDVLRTAILQMQLPPHMRGSALHAPARRGLWSRLTGN